MRIVILLVLGLSLSGCHLAFQDALQHYYGVGADGTYADDAGETTSSGATSGGRQARSGGGGHRQARRGYRGRRHSYRGGRRGGRRGRRR